MVNTLLENEVANDRSGALAGPLTTRPVVENLEPWQGQT